jgi:phospholipase C
MEMKKSLDRKWRATAKVGVFALILQMVSPAFVAAQDNSGNTTSPIKHVIVIIGENRTFDHVFATYKPKSGETVAQSAFERYRQRRWNSRSQFCVGSAVFSGRYP